MTRSSEARVARHVARLLVDYRVPICATLMIAALASTFALGSQSASSFATYVLALHVFLGGARWRGLFLDWGVLLVVALLVYIPLTSLWSTPWNGRGAFSQLTRALLVFAFVVSFAECMQVDWFRRRATLAIATVAAVAAVAAFWVFLTEPPWDERLNGLGQIDTHVKAGMVYAMAALCGIAWLHDAWGRARPPVVWGVVAAVAVLVVAVSLTGSRTATACGAFALVCLLLSHRVARPGRYLGLAAGSVGVLAAVLLVVYFALPGGEQLVLPRGDSFRPDIWAQFLGRIIADGPWFGLGVLTNDTTDALAPAATMHPHNLYLAVAHQGGAVGLALMLLVVATTARTLLQHYARADAKLGLAVWALALPGYLLDGHELVDKIGWTWLLFWLPVAIAIALRCGHVLADAARFGGMGLRPNAPVAHAA